MQKEKYILLMFQNIIRIVIKKVIHLMMPNEYKGRRNYLALKTISII